MKTLSRFLLVAMIFATFSTAAFAANAWPTNATLEIGSGVRAAYPGIEPSGLAWHDGRNQLLGVGDEGQLFAFNTDGSNVTLWNIGGDLEDVTVADSTSDFVYLADENGKIVKFNIATGSVVQSWDVTAWMPEVACGSGSKCGMEGLTYANGYFYAGYQLNGKIFVFDLSGSTAQKVNEFAGVRSWLGALHYRDGYLYALYGSTMSILDMNGNEKISYTVPVYGEGVALGRDSNGDGDANIYIAQDSGGIYSYDNFPIYGWTAPVVITDPDADGDGVVASVDCNDADATVSSYRSYFVDADLDGLGSTTSASLCSSTAPTGYATNSRDTNDAIPNAGVEIVGDKVDNDGDGKVDEVNTVEENGYHPYYSTLDPSTSSAGKIISVWALRYGDFGVRYGDKSNYRYSLANTRTKSFSKITLISGTAYAYVTVGSTTYKVNLYTGQVVE